MGGIGDAGVLQRDSVELDELRFPVRVESQHVVPDREGPGWRRGAPAAACSFTACETRFELMYLADGTVHPPLGARGGGAGGAATQHVRRTDGSIEELPVCARVWVEVGETVMSVCNGGGGYGDPLTREPERVLADVREGYVTRERARSVYAVVVTDADELDLDATAALRGAARA